MSIKGNQGNEWSSAYQYCEPQPRLIVSFIDCWNRYGPTPKNSDSAINILVDIVNDQSGKTYTMDHYATRYPTNVLDIAEFLVRLTGMVV
jgi:hypothetical protein